MLSTMWVSIIKVLEIMKRTKRERRDEFALWGLSFSALRTSDS